MADERLRHDPDDIACACWQCDNGRRIQRCKEERRRMFADVMAQIEDLQVTHVTDEVFEFALEQQDDRGPLHTLLHRELGQMLMLLGTRAFFVLAEARKHSGTAVRVGDIDWSWAEEKP